MPFTVDDSAILAGLDRLLATIEQEIVPAGLDAGAALLEAVDKSTTAYAGMSGATRDSTTAYAIGPKRDGSAKSSAGYAAAQAALAGFTGHSGQPLSQDAGITLADAEQGIILTNFTDYADKLEVEQAGAKAHLGDSLLSEATELTRIVANHSKARLG